MATEINDHALFKSTIANGKVFVDFYAQWCGPCKRIAPYIEKLAEEYKDITFIKVDVDQAEAISQELGISAMPTFKIFHNGKEAGELVGASHEEVTKIVMKLKAL